MQKRPPIPTELERQVLIEAGHRCAIPTCRQVPVEIAHIHPWSKCREHKFDNLIALCPTCHTRYDRGEIDRKSMLSYKQKLCLLHSRYGEFEQRVLKIFAQQPERDELWLLSDLEILVMYLAEDGLLADTGQTRSSGGTHGPMQKLFRLTSKGRDYLVQ